MDASTHARTNPHCKWAAKLSSKTLGIQEPTARPIQAIPVFSLEKRGSGYRNKGNAGKDGNRNGGFGSYRKLWKLSYRPIWLVRRFRLMSFSPRIGTSQNPPVRRCESSGSYTSCSRCCGTSFRTYRPCGRYLKEITKKNREHKWMSGTAKHWKNAARMLGKVIIAIWFLL